MTRARRGLASSWSSDRKRMLGLKLATLSRQLWSRFDQSVENTGLTRAKWTLIAAVGRLPGATQRSIAAALQVTEVTAGRMIDRLCEDGYLVREENPDDRRSYRVFLTSAAQPVIDQLGEVADEHTKEAFAGLDDEDLSKFESYLDIILGNTCTGRNQ